VCFQKPTSANLPVLKCAKYVYIKQFSFEKRSAQSPPLLEASQGRSCWFSKAFRKFKSFSSLTAKNLLIQYKIKGTVTIL
jgi:hypothetical protein